MDHDVTSDASGLCVNGHDGGLAPVHHHFAIGWFAGTALLRAWGLFAERFPAFMRGSSASGIETLTDAVVPGH
jgi:hypothetical protein